MIIVFERLEFSNCFSYANGNIIDLDKNPLTQLTGTNGAGKTSIPMILQEVTYGKNIKNIKKQDIANNKSGVKGFDIKLFFRKEESDIVKKYEIRLNRKASLSLKLFEDGKDISSHTSLNTYKTISSILGIEDFKVFCQLIYQHSTDSLEFLTATDTNRKKFLISLLQLDRYLELHEHYKQKTKEISSEISSLSGSVSTISSWITKHDNMDLSPLVLKEVPPVDETLIVKEAEIKNKLANIQEINNKINRNNEYKRMLDSLNSKYYLTPAPAVPNPSSAELGLQMREAETKIKSLQAKLEKLNKASGVCFTCYQEVDEESKATMVEDCQNEVAYFNIHLKGLKTKAIEAHNVELEINKHKHEVEEFEKLSRLVDQKIATETLDKAELDSELNEVTRELHNQKQKKELVERENIKVEQHNSTIRVVKEQLVQMRKELAETQIELDRKQELQDILDLLKKTFGTNGLVSYKIESSVKELEKEINSYLSELTTFQIYFKLVGEKLNIEVLDDAGNITSVANLSTGERGRVNIATVLAIRKIMTSLTSTKFNLLFLDEIIGVIDSDGKEKLTEILLNENLNTFIVSHDWNHPLIPRLNIVKEHNVSRIELDGD